MTSSCVSKILVPSVWSSYTAHEEAHDVIKWKHFLHHWPFVWGIHRSTVNSRNKGQRRGALMFSLICAWTKDWVSNRDVSDLRCHHAHYDITVKVHSHWCVWACGPAVRVPQCGLAPNVHTWIKREYLHWRVQMYGSAYGEKPAECHAVISRTRKLLFGLFMTFGG